MLTGTRKLMFLLVTDVYHAGITVVPSLPESAIIVQPSQVLVSSHELLTSGNSF